jgi:hypothetical protein
MLLQAYDEPWWTMGTFRRRTAGVSGAGLFASRQPSLLDTVQPKAPAPIYGVRRGIWAGGISTELLRRFEARVDPEGALEPKEREGRAQGLVQATQRRAAARRHHPGEKKKRAKPPSNVAAERPITDAAIAEVQRSGDTMFASSRCAGPHGAEPQSVHSGSG